MGLSEDLFGQIEGKLQDFRGKGLFGCIKSISIYSYYNQERRGVLLKAEVANYGKCAEELAELTRQLVPIGGKSVTFVCQQIVNHQGDGFHAREDLKNSRYMGWKSQGIGSEMWSRMFSESLLETQEFDEDFLQSFRNRGNEHNDESVKRHHEAQDFTSRFLLIVQKHCVAIAQHPTLPNDQRAR